MTWLHLSVDVCIPGDIYDAAPELMNAFHEGIKSAWLVADLTIDEIPGEPSEEEA